MACEVMVWKGYRNEQHIYNVNGVHAYMPAMVFIIMMFTTRLQIFLND